MKNPLPNRSVKRWYAWNETTGQFFPTYEEAWRFTQKVFENTGRTLVIEPVYAV